MQLGQPSENALAKDVGHRPWAPPDVPWTMFQSWRDVLFMHWPMAPSALRPLVPPQLAVDVFDGTAWLTLTPLEMRDVHLRGLPPLPGISRFPELNLRTYVRHRGKPGVFFFSLDTTNRLATLSARTFFRLPYRHASMRMERTPDGTRFESRRRDAEFIATYRSIGAELEPGHGSLEHFLVERYALYSALPGRSVLRGEIHHRPWKLRSAIAEVERDDIARAHGIKPHDVPPILHHAERQDILAWPPIPSRTRAALIPTYG